MPESQGRTSTGESHSIHGMRTLPRSSRSTEFVLPLCARARFPGRVIRSTGHASSIRTSLDRARDVTDGPPGSCCRSHAWPILPVPRCTLHPERKTPTLRRESALNLFQAPPRSSAMRNSSPRGPPSCFQLLVPQTPQLGNGLETVHPVLTRPASGSAGYSRIGNGRWRNGQWVTWRGGVTRGAP